MRSVWRQLIREGEEDHVHHIIEAMKYIIVEDAEHAVSLQFEIGCAARIVVYVVIFEWVAPSTDDEGGFATKKIDGEWT